MQSLWCAGTRARGRVRLVGTAHGPPDQEGFPVYGLLLFPFQRMVASRFVAAAVLLLLLVGGMVEPAWLEGAARGRAAS